MITPPITPQQRQHIMQHPEFQQRMSDAIDGMKYEGWEGTDAYTVDGMVIEALGKVPYSAIGVDLLTYRELCLTSINLMNIGLCQKALSLILDTKTLERNNVAQEHVRQITIVHMYLEHINDILRPIADKIISELHAKFTAANKIIK